MNLRNIDLNLMLIFDALMETKSVKKAAAKVALSESAFSHALARLRENLGDDLFIRRDNQMQPTALAYLIAPRITESLLLLQQALDASKGFDPTKDEKTFTIVANDYAQMTLIPSLMTQWQHLSRGIKLHVEKMDKQALTAIANQEIDFVIATPFSGEVPPIVESQILLEEPFLMIARSNHPGISSDQAKPVSLDSYIHYPHILVVHWDGKPGTIDEKLNEMGLKRDVMLTLSSPLVIAETVAKSDFFAILPRSLALLLSKEFAITTRPLPLPAPTHQSCLYFHKTRTQERSYQWLKQHFVDISSLVER